MMSYVIAKQHTTARYKALLFITHQKLFSSLPETSVKKRKGLLNIENARKHIYKSKDYEIVFTEN